jgi:protein-L-isoaspartate(D-aspartate) O-methyltransferase
VEKESPERFNAERARMVTDQLRKRGISDERVLHAMETVPRERFVPPGLQSRSYEDCPLPIACEQTISQPYIVALMLELMHLKPDSRVLEIGTGSGYQTALLAGLCASVVSIERHEVLSNNSAKILHSMNLTNVQMLVGDGTLGAAENAPYDAIVVTAGGPVIPNLLPGQLADGGRLLCPVGDRKKQVLMEVQRIGEKFIECTYTRCRFVPLIGEFGWNH